MEEIRIESEGVTVLIKEDQNKEGYLSFRLRDDKKILPFYVNVTKRDKRQLFLYVQFPQEETSKFIILPCEKIIDHIEEIVVEVLDLVALHEEDKKS